MSIIERPGFEYQSIPLNIIIMKDRNIVTLKVSEEGSCNVKDKINI